VTALLLPLRQTDPPFRPSEMHKKRHSLCFSLSLSFLTALSPPLPLHSTPLTRAHLPHKCTFHTSTSLLLFPRNHISKHGLFHRLCSLRHRRPYPHQGQRRSPASTSNPSLSSSRNPLASLSRLPLLPRTSSTSTPPPSSSSSRRSPRSSRSPRSARRSNRC
jgi:hypothetical protein